MRKPALCLPLVVLVLSVPSCRRPPVSVPPEGPRNGIEIGLASWYGPGFHGRPTSSREIYNMHDMTAAHPTLPFGTYVMITNLENERTAIVRINDRGPFVAGRIIDLSRAAASVLGIVGPGTARVRLEVLSGYRETASSSARFFVQVGSFAVQENAYALKRRLETRYEGVAVAAYRTAKQVYYRVRVAAPDRAAALRTAERLAGEGFPVIIMEE
jgi:rare lipoprotein A